MKDDLLNNYLIKVSITLDCKGQDLRGLAQCIQLSTMGVEPGPCKILHLISSDRKIINSYSNRKINRNQKIINQFLLTMLLE